MNIRRILVNFIFIIVSFILQTTLFRALDFGGIAPNVLMIMTSSTAFIKGDKAGLLTGFFCGLLVDIFFGTYLGFFALIYMYIGFIVGQFSREFFRQNILSLFNVNMVVNNSSSCMIPGWKLRLILFK